MKLFLSLLIVFCGGGWSLAMAHGVKEPVYPPYCWVQPTGSILWYECGSEEALMVDCLKLMESAMKGVDPFVTDPSLTSTQEETVRIKKVWERAKTSCWSDLKDKQTQHYH